MKNISFTGQFCFEEVEIAGRLSFVNDSVRPQPVISGSQVLGAGLASTTAAIVTSKFGVAGTLIGAAITSMIITGGSAVFRAYLESVTGNVRRVPHKIRAKANRRRADRYSEPPVIPDRPDLLNNRVGRFRAALGWFSHLPPMLRRPILIKALAGTVIAFVIGMVVVTTVEAGIGNSLACGFWSKCPTGAAPGVHVGVDRQTGATSSVSLARPKSTSPPTDGTQQPGSSLFGGGQEAQPSPSDPAVTPDPNQSVDPAVPQDPASGTETPQVPQVPQDPASGTETPSQTPSAEPAPAE